MKHIYILIIIVFGSITHCYPKEYFVQNKKIGTIDVGKDRPQLTLEELSECPTCYPGDLTHPFFSPQYACERIIQDKITFKLSPGDIVYVRSGEYYPKIQNISTPILLINAIVGTETNPVIIKNYPGEKPTFHPYLNSTDPLLSGSWALVKIHPKVLRDAANAPATIRIPAYIRFEGIELIGNATTINREEKTQYENQKGSYCPNVDGEGFLNLSSCQSLAGCTDTDSDGIANDGACEPVRYNGQGMLVTGPFAWDPQIKDLIPRGKNNLDGDYPNAIPHHITVRNCTFKEFPGAGISFQRADYITVENCTVANNCWYTIFGSSGINLYQMVPYEGTAVKYENDTDYRIKIINNIVYGNSLRVENQNLVVRYDGNGIIVDDFAHEQDYRPKSILNQQRIQRGLDPIPADKPNPTNPNRGNFYYGPYQGKTLVANNIIYGNGGSGLKVYSSQYVDVIHNTFFNNGIGNYRNFRDPNDSTYNWLRPQFSLFVQPIVDETKTDPRPTIMPGYHRVFNNLTYNTLNYPNDGDVEHGGYTTDMMAYNVANNPLDQNIVDRNFVGNPTFINTSQPALNTNNNSAVSYTDGCFKLSPTSPTINYGVYQSKSPNDRDNYSRDALPDAGAYEVSTNCQPYISVGSNYPVVPADFNSSVSATDRKVYRSQNAITLKDVYSIPYGAVFTTEVTSCNMTPNPVAAGRMIAEHFEAPPQENNELTESLKTAYPNPISEGSLQFSTRIAQYKLFNAAGKEILNGNDADQMSIEGLTKGLYLINLDGQTQKIVIE